MNSAPDTTVSRESSGNDGASHHAASLPRPVKPVLSEEMLTRFASRAPACDRENRFIDEDFEEDE